MDVTFTGFDKLVLALVLCLFGMVQFVVFNEPVNAKYIVFQ